LGELVDERELVRGEEAGRTVSGGRGRGREPREGCDEGRTRRELQGLATAEPGAACFVAHSSPFLSWSARCSQDRQARAMIVQVGFWHDALTWLLPSTTKRFLTSCDCWNWLRTEVFGSAPIRDVPSSWIDQPSVSMSVLALSTSKPASSNICRPD